MRSQFWPSEALLHVSKLKHKELAFQLSNELVSLGLAGKSVLQKGAYMGARPLVQKLCNL